MEYIVYSMIKIVVTEEAKKILAKLILISYAINVHIIIIVSYFNDYSITITTNTCNEGLIEVFILPIVTLWAIYQLVKKE